MQQLPKIARERLKISVSAAGHPDPDVLTAFSEQTLPKAERALVLEHLARCGDCREVVALALPAWEEVEVSAVAGPDRTSWLTWPGLRWGVVAAAVAVVASFGVLQYLKRPAALTVASRIQQEPRADGRRDAGATNRDAGATNAAATNEVAAYDSAQPASPPPMKEQDQSKNLKREAAPRARTTAALSKPAASADAIGSFSRRADRASTAGGSGAGVGTSVSQGPKMAMVTPLPGMSGTPELKDNAAFPPKPARPPAAVQENAAAPSVPETVEVQARAEAIQTQNRDQNQQQAPANETQQQQIADNSRQEVFKAKPSGEAQRAASATLASSPADTPALQTLHVEGRNMQAQTSQPPYQWTINSSGGLQRSFDMGKTWQNVEVSEDASSSFTYLTGETLAKQSKEAKADKKEREKKAASNTLFRAVTVAGPEVWAGGSGGMLYHSVDGGDHWARIVLKAAGVVFTGDITSVEFSDPQHGRITTSTSQVWITSDGGKSWHD